MILALNILSHALYVINVVFVCPLLNCNHFYQKHLDKNTHFSQHYLHFLILDRITKSLIFLKIKTLEP